ncbi:uncharacterized protein G2W53_004856 [Senna tora]|uniref:Uncharacterized protein n=1 Tax=Senna tora TaxID=362788 RepID=A0A834XBW9_9FABA|nr:uncharacterized protein G2W53_004856 [Senna tora]
MAFHMGDVAHWDISSMRIYSAGRK